MNYPSRLTTWLDCPKRFRMAYVDRPPPPKGPPWAHISFGTTLHNVLRAWVTAPPAERTPEQAAHLVGEAWIGDGYRDAGQQAEWRDRAAGIASGYVATLDPRAEPPGVERTVALLHDGVALAGRVDRIDDRGDEVVVVDYKTGRRPPATDDVRGSLALGVYAAAAAHTLNRPCRTVELHHLPTRTVVSWTHTAESIERHLRRAADIATEARAATEFPARPGPQCAWCDFARVCDDAALPPRQPWDGLGEGQPCW